MATYAGAKPFARVVIDRKCAPGETRLDTKAPAIGPAPGSLLVETEVRPTLLLFHGATRPRQNSVLKYLP